MSETHGLRVLRISIGHYSSITHTTKDKTTLVGVRQSVTFAAIALKIHRP